MTKQEKSFEEVRSIIVSHRCVASRGVNTESILMSWKVGSYISAKLPAESSKIEQFKTAQLALPPQILFLTTFSNHVEIINRCKSNEERGRKVNVKPKNFTNSQ